MAVTCVAEPVDGIWLGGRLALVLPSARRMYAGEIGEAIGRAASEDPLWPQWKNGCAKTAAFLLSWAKAASDFQPNLISASGKAFGLFQIEPPSGIQIDARMLLLPREAAFIAIDLLRQKKVQPRADDKDFLFLFSDSHVKALP